MHQHEVARLLVSATAITAAILVGAEDQPAALVSVGTKRAQHIVGDRFLGLTVDPAVLLETARTSSESLQMLAMARSLSPAFLRVAGPGSNAYLFRKTVDPDRSELSADHTVTELQWTVLNEFAQQAGLQLVVSLGVTDREQQDGSWSSRSALELVSLSDKLGYNLSWQLGYELQELRKHAGLEMSGSQLGRDVVQLRKMLDVFPRYRRSLVLAPDVTRFAGREDAHFLKEFFGEAGGAISAVTWHPHFKNGFENSEAHLLTNILDTGGNALRRSISRTFNKKPLWIAESESTVSQGDFKDALAWCHRLGSAAQLGAEVILKRLDLLTMTRPSPEYWVSILHKTLVGRAVLDTRMVQGNHTHLRVFAHCAAQDAATPRYGVGAVTLFGVNFMDEDATVTLKAASWGHGAGEDEVHQYLLTSSAGDPESTDTLLNGQSLRLNPDGSLPALVPTIHHTEQAVEVTIPPKSVGFWVIPSAQVRPCMASAPGKRPDHEDQASGHHRMDMEWEPLEVNSDFADGDVVGLRRLRRKHSPRPKLTSLSNRKKKNKGRILGSGEGHSEKIRTKILGRPKRYTPLENGPYIIPGLSVELFNPSQQSMKHRIGANKRKKNILSQPNIGLPKTRRRLKALETDEDFTVSTNVRASLANPDYYSAEDEKQFSKHRKRDYGAGFAQNDKFLTTGTSSNVDNLNKDYEYVDEMPTEYEAEDNFNIDSKIDEQDGVHYFHGPGEFCGNGKLPSPTQNNQQENFGRLWDIDVNENAGEQEPEGRDMQKVIYKISSTPDVQTHITRNLHVTPVEPPSLHVQHNSYMKQPVSASDNRMRLNNQYHKQTSPKYIVQNNDHEFLLFSNGENIVNGHWMRGGQHGGIRTRFNNYVAEEKTNLELPDHTSHGLNTKIYPDRSNQINVHRIALEKPADTFIQTPLGENQGFTNEKSVFWYEGNKQQSDEMPKNFIAKQTNRIVPNNSEDDGLYMLEQLYDANRMTTDRNTVNTALGNQKQKVYQADSYNISSGKHKIMDPNGKNVSYSNTNTNTNTTDSENTTQQNYNEEMKEHSIEIMKHTKSRPPRHVSAHYKHVPSAEYLNRNVEQPNYYENTKPIVFRSRQYGKHEDDYSDYDADGSSLEKLIFARILPTTISNSDERVGRPRVELTLRPTFGIEPLYYEYYKANDMDSKSKFDKRDEAKQLQEDLKQPDINSNRKFFNLDAIDLTDKILQLRDIYSPKAVKNDTTIMQMPDEISTYLSTDKVRQSEHTNIINLTGNPSSVIFSTNLIDQTESVVRNPQASVTPTEGFSTMLNDNLTQQEPTRNTPQTDDEISNTNTITQEEIRTHHPDSTTELGKFSNSDDEYRQNHSKNSLNGHTEDEDGALMITKYILSSVTTRPKYETHNANNLQAAAKYLPSNLDPAYLQASENFKLSKKRENMNSNMFNLIKLPIPKEKVDGKDKSTTGKVTNTDSLSTEHLEDKYTNEPNKDTFPVGKSDEKEIITSPTKDSESENNKKTLSDNTQNTVTGNAAKPADDNIHHPSKETTNQLENNMSKTDYTVDSSADHKKTSHDENLNSEEDKTVVENASTQDSTSHPVQSTHGPGNKGKVEGETTTASSQEVSKVPSDSADTTKSITHDTSQENSGVTSPSIPHNTKSHRYSADKMDTSQLQKQQSLHPDIAEFNETSESRESNAQNENNEKTREDKEHIKPSRVIRTHSEVSTGTRHSLPIISQVRMLPDATKRREERIKALNERYAKLRARLLTRTGNRDNEHRNISNRRKLRREAIGKSVDFNKSSDIDHQLFLPNVAIVDHTSEDTFNPSVSTEAFIEQYLLQQQHQIPLLKKQSMMSGKYNAHQEYNTNIHPEEGNESTNHDINSPHDKNQLQLGYSYKAPIRAYTSFILNSIGGSHNANSGTGTHKIIDSPTAYRRWWENKSNNYATLNQDAIQHERERKQRLVRESQWHLPHTHYYNYPETEASDTFSQEESTSEYPDSYVYDYEKLDKSHMPKMTLDYDAHSDDFMTDDSEDDQAHRYGRNIYIMEDHQWPDDNNYHEKLSGNQLLPFVFELQDPHVYEDDDFLNPEHDDMILDMTSYPDYSGYHNEPMTDETFDAFLQMLDETELQAENKLHLTELKGKGGSADGDKETHTTLSLKSDGKEEKKISAKTHSKISHRTKRSVNSNEMHDGYSKDSGQKTTEINNENAETPHDEDNLHSVQFKDKMTSSNSYPTRLNNIPGLLKISEKLVSEEDADINRIRNIKPKILDDKGWSKYSRDKIRAYRQNIQKNIHQIKSEVANHRQNYVGSSNSVSGTAGIEDSRTENKDDAEEVMHLVFYAYPEGESNMGKKDKPLGSSSQSLQPPEQHHDDARKSHLLDKHRDATPSLYSDDKSKEVTTVVKNKCPRSQSESTDINFASIIFQALGTIIKFFKNFELF